jgi:hypothetical protein
MSSLGMVFVEKLFFQSENEFEDIETNIWENFFAKLDKLVGTREGQTQSARACRPTPEGQTQSARACKPALLHLALRTWVSGPQ